MTLTQSSCVAERNDNTVSTSATAVLKYLSFTLKINNNVLEVFEVLVIYKCEFSVFRDARMCMHYISYWGGRNHITFVGDSRIRNLYYEFINLISLSELEEAKAQSDIHFSDEKINARVVSECLKQGFLFSVYCCCYCYKNTADFNSLMGKSPS